MSSALVKKLPASVSGSSVPVADRGGEEVNVGFSDFGAGSGNQLRDPRARRRAGNDRKFSHGNEFHTVGRTGSTQAHAASVRSVSSNRVLIVPVPLARVSALSRQSKPFKHLLTFSAAPRNQFLHELAHLLLI
jgi:hypothetical protein